MRIVYLLFATALGVGFSPIAPGTAGAIFAALILWFFNVQQVVSTTTTPILYIGMIVATIIMGIIASNKLENEWGKDSSKIVIDEVLGMWITMLFIPFNWLTLFLGFVLFRFFDIAKPLGIRKMEKLPGGVGVMSDDLLAGVYSNIILHLIVRFL